MDYCGVLSGHTRTMCIVEADGKRSVALAELEAAFRPSAGHSRAAALATEEAVFATTLARCEAGPPFDRAVCTDLARTDLKASRAAIDLFYGPSAMSGRASRKASPARDARQPPKR